MEAKITPYRTLQIYPSEYSEDGKIAETIFIECILGLKNEGDSIVLTRKNASGLSCLAYLECGAGDGANVEPYISQPSKH